MAAATPWHLVPPPLCQDLGHLKRGQGLSELGVGHVPSSIHFALRNANQWFWMPLSNAKLSNFSQNRLVLKQETEIS